MSVIAFGPCFLSPLLPVCRRRVSHPVPLCTRSQPQAQPQAPTAPSTQSLVPLPATPLSPLSFRGRTIHVKRDDLLVHRSLRGSKLRKFHSLLCPSVLPADSLVISYGGVQSNAMVALAELCAIRQLPFYYITRPIPAVLPESEGNFANALNLGMVHLSIPSEDFRNKLVDVDLTAAVDTAKGVVAGAHLHALRVRKAVVVPQGGAWPLAEAGLRELASELREQIGALHLCGRLALHKPVLFLAAGTGTTAYYLAKHLGDSASVVAVPVSGDERYLVRQMRRLATWEGGSAALPGILRPRLRGSFADVRAEKLAIWREMGRAARTYEFDLVYAPKAWEEVMLALQEGRLGKDDEDLIYYHSGGIEGNVSMLGKFA